jgi:hypothetical protein
MGQLTVRKIYKVEIWISKPNKYPALDAPTRIATQSQYCHLVKLDLEVWGTHESLLDWQL